MHLNCRQFRFVKKNNARFIRMIIPPWKNASLYVRESPLRFDQRLTHLQGFIALSVLQIEVNF